MLQYLVAAGVGSVIIVDRDVVSLATFTARCFGATGDIINLKRKWQRRNSAC